MTHLGGVVQTTVRPNEIEVIFELLLRLVLPLLDFLQH